MGERERRLGEGKTNYTTFRDVKVSISKTSISDLFHFCLVFFRKAHFRKKWRVKAQCSLQLCWSQDASQWSSQTNNLEISLSVTRQHRLMQCRSKSAASLTQWTSSRMTGRK